MNIKELLEKAYTTAKLKGWWDKPRSPLDIHMLIVTEIAEATKAVRDSESDIITNDAKQFPAELVELADAIIRIADYCGHNGWDLDGALEYKMNKNMDRPYRHGNKKY